MLEIKSLNKIYKEKTGSVQALKDVNLKIDQGEIVGLFGENGAGKTTLLKCILGFLPFQGEILLDGKKIDRGNIARLSFATCEHSFFLNLTPISHSEFYQMHFGTFRHKRFEALMDFFGLPVKTALKNYSTGQKNQFEVILALCQGADYILMDEPFAGNDVFNREDFYKVLLGILEPEETIFLSTHLIEEVERFIGRAILLKKGRVVGEISTLELEEQNRSLIGYVKETYGYRSDRVNRALEKLTDEM
ncbi:MAG: ABC transporter ATP-binding protein [Acetatifactor sp.]|nr:ABC transporter ATP-binding protein [Acetatifactor sp.]